jgi:DNA polymerase III delta subunit
MNDWPPVLFVSGSEGFLRRRFVAEIVAEARSCDRVIDYVNAKEPGALRSMLSGGVFIETPTLVLITNPEKVDLDVVDAHDKAGDNTYILLLHAERTIDARTKFGKYVKAHKKQHRSFVTPVSWKAEGVAAEFCVEEAKRHGKTLGSQIAKALVSVIGTDLGVLHYEILKAATLATADGAGSIEVRHIRGSKAPLAEAEIAPVIRALEAVDLSRVLKALDRVKVTSKTDPTIKTCRFIAASTTKWVAAANLDAIGYPAKEAADTLGMNPWFYENKVLPPAVRWGVPKLARLLRAVAASERSVKLGHVEPWAAFQARLAKVVLSS